MLYTAVSSKTDVEYRAGAAVGMTMAMQARNSSEQDALFTVALNFCVGYLYPPIRKQQPAGRRKGKGFWKKKRRDFRKWTTEQDAGVLFGTCNRRSGCSSLQEEEG